MEVIKLTIIGFVLGITAIIPGLSVATIAVVFNVYDRLINVIVFNVKKIIEALSFWLPMVIGGLCGVLFASKILTVLFNNYYVPTYWFFIGIIIGSLPVIYSRVIPEPAQKKSIPLPSLKCIFCIIAALAAMLAMEFIRPDEGIAVYTELTAPLFVFLLITGMLAALAMIIPGISGAFVLLVIGMYRTALQAVADLNALILIPIILGACIGLLLGAAFVRFLLLKAPKETYSAVLGLVTGSIFVLFPGGFGDGIGILVSITCLLAGFFISFIVGRQKNIE